MSAGLFNSSPKLDITGRFCRPEQIYGQFNDFFDGILTIAD
jgi:hypothetical protein